MREHKDESGQPAAGNYPWDRTDHRVGHRRHNRRSLVFRSGRELAAWIGLVPRQHSSGGKAEAGPRIQAGRSLSATLADSWCHSGHARDCPARRIGLSVWVRVLLDRRPFRLVSLALANKMARIAWAVMVRQEDYRRPLMAAAA